ncbi:MAG: hypothetical protein AVDCRST_MAG72-1512, partial [uncultured Nocardioidaceae bacterium]
AALFQAACAVISPVCAGLLPVPAAEEET